MNLSSVYILLKPLLTVLAKGEGDGNSFKDILIAADCKSVKVRSERSSSGDGRVYTITFKVKDAGGNSTTATARVVVPLSHGVAAIDSGPKYTVDSSCRKPAALQVVNQKSLGLPPGCEARAMSRRERFPFVSGGSACALSFSVRVGYQLANRFNSRPAEVSVPHARITERLGGRQINKLIC